jgi:aspartate racemase
MKTIGMIGGMSWESSSEYYRIINREVQQRLGGVHSAKVLLWSFDFAEITALQSAGDWGGATQRMIAAARVLAHGGADFLIICCNTMHLMAEAVEDGAGIPLLHIADPLGAKIAAAGIDRVGLLGSIYTMEADFIRTRLAKTYGIQTIVPEGGDAEEVNRVIYEELPRGRLLESSRAFYRGVISRLIERGAQGIVLGCTELPLLVKADDSRVPLFDTTGLHALAAVDRALA